jgi:transcriptional regulator with XRE-family HTH domain
MNIKDKIGSRIRQLRQEKHLSQEAFADLCELDRTYISSIEKGKRNVSIINLEKIAIALNINLSTLFNDL